MRNLTNANRIVVKVGTSVLTNPNGTLNENLIKQLADVLAALRKSGKTVSLVTCGAIPAGITKLRLPFYPNDMKSKQAAAAVGQSMLMSLYDKCFGRHGISVAQLLLTKYTVQRDDSLANVTNTINALFGLGVIPIINENDPIITDEIKLGDNDALAAHVANIIYADLLIILTNVDGLYSKNPKTSGARIIPEVSTITDEIKAAANFSKKEVKHGSGGMLTKISAAVMASKSGTKTLILNGYNPKIILDALKGAPVGTYFDIKRYKN